MYTHVHNSITTQAKSLKQFKWSSTDERINKTLIKLNIFQPLKGLKYWYMLQCGWTLKIFCQVKAASQKGPHSTCYVCVLLNICMEKAVAPHSSTLAWKIPWTDDPGRLQSRGSLRVGHDWATSLSLFTFMQWRRKWQPTPVFLPGESQGQGSLVGCCLWGRTESDTTEVT